MPKIGQRTSMNMECRRFEKIICVVTNDKTQILNKTLMWSSHFLNNHTSQTKCLLACSEHKHPRLDNSMTFT